VTHAGCSTRQFNEVVELLADRNGSPCFGCTEKTVGFRIPLFQRVTYTPRLRLTLTLPFPVRLESLGSAAGLVGLAAVQSADRPGLPHSG